MRFYPKNLFTNRQHHGACGPALGSELALPVASCEPAPELSGFCAAGPLSSQPGGPLLFARFWADLRVSASHAMHGGFVVCQPPAPRRRITAQVAFCYLKVLLAF